MRSWLALLGAAALLLPGEPASAHVTFVTQEVAAGSAFEVALNVPHGCKGSPTVRLRVRIPKGIVDANPHAKPGWKEAVVEGKGSARGEIAWSGRLPDKELGEFMFTARAAADIKPGTILHFPVVQECEKGVERWIDTKSKGGTGGHGAGDDYPAPAIRILPKH